MYLLKQDKIKIDLMMSHFSTYSNGAPVHFSLRCAPSKGELATTKHWTFHFFKNKNITWWLMRTEPGGKYYNKKILDFVIPQAIQSILDSDLITRSESENLLEMIKSPDKENLTIALIVIIGYKKEQIKLNKFIKHGRR